MTPPATIRLRCLKAVTYQMKHWPRGHVLAVPVMLGKRWLREHPHLFEDAEMLKLAALPVKPKQSRSRVSTLQLKVMGALSKRHSVSMQAIRQELWQGPQTTLSAPNRRSLSRSLRRLMSKGFVEKQPKRHWGLTLSGRHYLGREPIANSRVLPGQFRKARPAALFR